MHRRNPLHCLVPDYVLREIARRGGETEREAALDSLGVSATLRSARTQAEAGRAAIGSVRLPSAALRAPRVDRVIRNAAGGTDLAAPVVRREGDPDSGDPAIDEAFEHFGSTWDFFFDVLARNSIDNAGMTLDGVVHYGRNFDNAFWDGDQMVFGDGSGTLFTRLTQSLSVCAHELGHGVIQFDGPLVYQSQSGALNEHIADAFGVMVHQWKHGQTVTEADWLIGAEILAEGVDGQALRSMKQPGTAYDDDMLGKDPQPGHMDGYVDT
ncbi:MAG: M4 family metallopeptidase, partial [Actinobacteria bacterium]|nr:M4 family metallopeptidase [Actinomycetota bacterium]